MKNPTQTILLKWLAGMLLCGWLAVPASAVTNTWDANGATAGITDGVGTWSTTDANWWNGTSTVVWPNGTGDGAIFGTNNGAAGVVTVSGGVNANAIIFTAPGSGNYTIQGSTITLTGALPTISNSVNATIGSVLAGSAGLVKTGAGTLSLTNVAISYTGNTTVNNGTLVIKGASSFGNNPGRDFNVQGGNTFLVSGTGVVTHPGTPGASYFVAGSASAGTLTVQDSGFVNVNTLAVGWSAAGVVNLSGNGTITSAGDAAIGVAAAATWNQSGGTANLIGNTQVSWFGGPTTFNISGGTFNQTAGFFRFGASANATWIQTGGVANFAGDIYVADGGVLGSMTVSGGSLTNTSAGTFYVGTFGTGTLTVNNTATTSGFVSANTLKFGNTFATSKGIVNVVTGGTLRVGSGGVTYGNGSGTLNFNGGTFQAGAASVAIANNANLKLMVNDGGAVFDTLGNTITVNGALVAGTGSGGLTKYGTGKLILNGINTYAGSTIVNNGTLSVTASGGLFNNGSDKVFVRVSDNSFTSSTTTSMLIRTVSNVDFGTTAYGSQSLGSLGTKADIIDSYNVSRTVTMQWRKVNLALDVGGQMPVVSDVLRLTGLNGTNFVLQMSYNSDAFDATALLGWRNLSGIWTNAVAGNVGGTANFVGDVAYNSSFFSLGNWGKDTANNVVWAVVNHNSDFAVLAIPEPSVVLMWLAGAVTLWAARRRRQHGR